MRNASIWWSTWPKGCAINFLLSFLTRPRLLPQFSKTKMSQPVNYSKLQQGFLTFCPREVSIDTWHAGNRTSTLEQNTNYEGNWNLRQAFSKKLGSQCPENLSQGMWDIWWDIWPIHKVCAWKDAVRLYVWLMCCCLLPKCQMHFVRLVYFDAAFGAAADTLVMMTLVRNGGKYLHSLTRLPTWIASIRILTLFAEKKLCSFNLSTKQTQGTIFFGLISDLTITQTLLPCELHRGCSQVWLFFLQYFTSLGKFDWDIYARTPKFVLFLTLCLSFFPCLMRQLCSYTLPLCLTLILSAPVSLLFCVLSVSVSL